MRATYGYRYTYVDGFGCDDWRQRVRWRKTRTRVPYRLNRVRRLLRDPARLDRRDADRDESLSSADCEREGSVCFVVVFFLVRAEGGGREMKSGLSIDLRVDWLLYSW